MIHSIHRFFKLDNIINRFFFWVMVLIILTSLLYLFIYIGIDKKNRIDNANENLAKNLKNQQIIVENWANDRMENIRLLASFPVSKDLELDAMETRFEYYAQYYEQLNSIVFVDEEGFVYIDTAAEETIRDGRGGNLKERPYFIAAEKGKEYVYDVVASNGSSEPALIFSSPVFSDNNLFRGLVFGAVHLSKVNDMLQDSIQGETGEITLVNEDGMILSHLAKESNKEIEVDTLSTEFNKTIFSDIKNNSEGFIQYVNHHGDEVLASFVSLYDGRYYLVNEIDKREILLPHYQMISIMVSITVAIIILAFILFLPISKRLLMPFFYLLEGIKKIKAGNYETRLEPNGFKTSPVELQQIMQGFNEMAISIYDNKKMLQHISNTDGLTGVANRRLFEQRLKSAWYEAKEGDWPISLVFLDVDFFKKFNDHFGHQKGDECLVEIATAIDQLLNDSNHLLARYGGEEFIIILHKTNSEEAVVVAEAVRKQVKDLQILRSKTNSEEVVTASIGVATMVPTESTTKSSLIQLADQALYEAKSLGRDRVIVKNDQEKNVI